MLALLHFQVATVRTINWIFIYTDVLFDRLFYPTYRNCGYCNRRKNVDGNPYTVFNTLFL